MKRAMSFPEIVSWYKERASIAIAVSSRSFGYFGFDGVLMFVSGVLIGCIRVVTKSFVLVGSDGVPRVFVCMVVSGCGGLYSSLR